MKPKRLFEKIKNIFIKKKNVNLTHEKGDNQCEIVNNKNFTSSNNNNDDKKNNIINNNALNYSPNISFSRLQNLYLNEFSNEMWNGLKLSLNFKPTQLFNLSYDLNIEKNKKLFNKYSLNAGTFIPLSSSLFPINYLLMGNKDSSKTFNLQNHLFIGEKDKLSIVTSTSPKNDNNLFLNENINSKKNNNELETNYSIEYIHEFNRGNLGVKLTNMGPNSLNFLFSLYKNLFFGMEFFKNPNIEEKSYFLKANYGILLKQTEFNKLGIIFNYISTLPGAIFNCSYQINDNFKIFLNTGFNKNEIMLKYGCDKFTGAISSFYKNDFIELNTELNNKGEVKFLSKFFFNKYFDILTNFTYNHKKSKSGKKFKLFGFGLNINNVSVEEKIEDLINNQKKIYSENDNFYNNIKNIMKLK